MELVYLIAEVAGDVTVAAQPVVQTVPMAARAVAEAVAEAVVQVDVLAVAKVAVIQLVVLQQLIN